ncbi:MAG: MBL fold metallo-hydrolase [Promethearchaeota archaeon]
MSKFKSEVNKIEDVYRIKIDVPFAVRYVCVYLFDVDDKKVLIDAGLNMGKWDEVFYSLLEDLKLTISDIDYCIVTHRHIDHVGLIKSFKRKNPNIQILMHDITEQNLKWESDGSNHETIDKIAKESSKLLIKYGMPEVFERRMFNMISMWAKMTRYQKPDKVLQNGDEIIFPTNKLKTIWTPGHSMGHICIFDNNKKYLYSGDHILSRITPHIGNFLINPDLKVKCDIDFNDILAHYLKSLDVISDLNPKIIFPAHQDVIYNPQERINEIKLHHEKRLKEISSLIENKPMTPFEISKIHFGEDLDDINSYLALSEVLGHLIYLENQEKVTRIERDEKFYFSC